MPTPTRTLIVVLAVLSRASLAIADAPASPPSEPARQPPADAASAAPPSEPSASATPAVPEVPIVVQTGGDAAAIVDDAALREAIGRELRQPVLAPSARVPDHSPRLVVTFGSDGTLRVAFREASGREIVRTVTRPTDSASIVQLIALLAGNLARNEAGEIEAELMIREDGTPPAQTPAAGPTVIVIQQPAVATPAVAPVAAIAPSNDRASSAGSRPPVDPLHAGRVYIHANAVGGVLLGSSYTFVGGGAGIGIRARHFALEVTGGFAELPWRPLGYASVLAFARFEAWRFEFAFGGGPSAMISPSTPTPQAGTGPYPGPPPPPSTDWGIGATAAARMSFALAGPIDLYAQAEASYMLDPGHTYSQAALAMFSGGLQARFAP